MPRVPTANELGNVSLKPLANKRRTTAASPSLLSGGTTQQLGELGGSVQEAAQGANDLFTSMRERERERKLNEHLIRMEDYNSEVLQQGENALLQRQGANAKGAAATYDERMSKFLDSALEAEEDPEVRQRLQREFTDLTLRSQDAVAQHEARELRQASDQTSQAKVALAVQNGAAYHTDPELLQRARQKLEAGLDEQAQINGWTPEMRELQGRQHRTQFHRSVTQAMLDGNPERARDYLQRNREEMTPEAAAQLEQQIEDQGRRVAGQQWADRIVSQDLNRQEQLDLARRELSDRPELRDEVVQRVQQRHAEIDRTQRHLEERSAEEAFRIVLEEGGRLEDVPADTRQHLDPQTKTEIQKVVAKRRSGEAISTDTRTYYNLRRLATSSDPSVRQKFADTNLMKFRGKLDDSDFKELVKLQEDVRQGETSPDSVAVRSRQDVVDQGLADLGYEPGVLDETGSDGEVARKFARRVDREAQAYRQRNGEAPGPEELQKIVDRLSIKATEGQSLAGVNALWPDAQTPTFQLEVEGVPAGEVDELAQGLQRNGLEVTPANIRRLYERMR